MAALATALAVSLVGIGAPAFGAELSGTGAESFADIAACAASGDHLLAAIVVDSSGSLRETDPSDQRVGAILQALDSLEHLHISSKGSLNVQASLSTFGVEYVPLVGWGAVEADHANQLRSAATATLPSRDSDRFTDYRAALRGAQASIDTQASKLDGTSCKVVLWFTDGRLDVGAQTEAARAELCAPQGIVDSLRGDHIAIVALALFTEGGGGSVTDQDRERLRAIAEGEGSGESCGTVPVPAASSGGAYLRAGDASAMRRLFAQATALIEGATPSVSITCPGVECVDGRLSIPVDPGVGGFRVILERGASGQVPILTAPSGESADATSQLTSLAGADIAVADRDGLATIHVTHPSSAAMSGQWTLDTDPLSTTLIDLYYFWGATLSIETETKLLVGEPGTVQLFLEDASGSAVDTDALSTFSLSVNVDGVERRPRATADGWEVDVEVAASDVPPAIRVEAAARATTSPSNIQLGPITAQAEIATSFPPSFPSVSPSRLAFPAILGSEPSTAELTFVGSQEGATRACIDEADIVAPASAGTALISSASECIDIPAGGTSAMEVVLSTQNAADGRVDGTIPVRLIAVDGAEEVTVSIPFGASMTRPVNEPVRWGLTALFVFLALALAWATAEISRRVSDRFVLGTDSRVASVPVIVSARGIRRQDARVTLLDPALDFSALGIHRKTRLSTFATSGLQFRRSFPLNPLAAGRPTASSNDGRIVVTVGGRDVSATPDASKAPVRFPGSIDNVLIIEHVPAEPNQDSEIIGRLVVVVDSPNGVASVLDDRVDQIERTDWDHLVTAILAASGVRADRAGKASAALAASSDRTEASTGRADPEPSRPPMPSSSWDDEPSLANPAASGAEPGPAGKKPLKGRHDPGRSTDSEATPDSPPPSVNFWD